MPASAFIGIVPKEKLKMIEDDLKYTISSTWTKKWQQKVQARYKSW